MHEVGKGVESEIHLRKLVMEKHFSPGAGLVCDFGLFGFANGLADFFIIGKDTLNRFNGV